jgi:ParB family transcriptional regulator, chromosome partitioning protein
LEVNTPEGPHKPLALNSGNYRNRIVGQGVKPASHFMANPWNWRLHSKRQQEALQQVLQQIGWVAQVIENVTTGHLIDGHLRVMDALKGDRDVPYIQVQLTEDEERLILASFDPIGALATADAAKLADLAKDLDLEPYFKPDELSTLLSIVPDFEPAGIDEQGRLDQKKPITCPNCGNEFVPQE